MWLTGKALVLKYICMLVVFGLLTARPCAPAFAKQIDFYRQYVEQLVLLFFEREKKSIVNMAKGFLIVFYFVVFMVKKKTDMIFVCQLSKGEKIIHFYIIFL